MDVLTQNIKNLIKKKKSYIHIYEIKSDASLFARGLNSMQKKPGFKSWWCAFEFMIFL